MLTPPRFCLTPQSHRVVLGQCDASNPSHHWAWTAGARLLHVQSSRCLWIDSRPGMPPSARLVKLSDCSTAPGWTCYGTQRAFGPVETHMYLRKLELYLVVAESPQTGFLWRRFDVDSGGKQRITSLCHNTGEFMRDTWF